jgi:uncharacterized protein
MEHPMPDEACPLPSIPDANQLAGIGRMLAAERIAVVGLSDDLDRPSHEVGRYLMEHGRQIIPINPKNAVVLGVKAYASLSEAPRPIDVVLVFRRPERCPTVARDAVAAGARGLWLQQGIVSLEAMRIARSAGLDYTENRCMMIESRRRANQ